jgi:hypothetical protein
MENVGYMSHMNLLGMVWFSPAQVHPVEPSDKPVEVKRKYKVRRKPKEKQKTNKKIKGKAKIREESQSSTPPAAPDDLPNTKDQVPKATRRPREETQSYDPIESTPAPAPEKQSSEQAQSAPKTSLFVDQPSDETGETKRYPSIKLLRCHGMVPGSKTEDVVPPYSRLFVLEYDPFYR